ncbi:MAG: extracellular solute-binding protein [Propionibacteriaceae bacterium]|jgi:N,N'-diacetylchitobiose transport system substrate-binding protein|nr:extracellular solute-binding protein [Propionibacteriaceae bacterium]
MKRILSMAAVATAAALALTGCGSDSGSGSAATSASASEAPATTEAAQTGENITFWLIGGDTPQDLRDYLIKEYKEVNGGTLTIEEQSWGDIIAKLTTSLPDPANTPDVTEIGNTQAPTFTNVGAFLDISDMYEELGGSKLLQGFVEVGSVDGKEYALPYYFGSRYMFYRKDIYAAAGVSVPTTLDEFNSTVATLAEANPNNIPDFSGFFIGGQDWRNGISWIFANGGDLAKYENGTWTSTLSDPNTIKGLEQLQQIQQTASKAPRTMKDESPWLYFNDSDSSTAEDGTTTATALAAATIMAPGWAHWSIGDLDADGNRVWNDEKFGVFVLPGNDGKPAPVFAGGSNIAISAKSQHVEGAKDLMRIIFSAEYQTLLAQNGLGPANSDYVSAMGSDEFTTALVESASNAKLTPAAPGWATVEGSGKLEEFFQKVAEGGDVTALAAEYDEILTPMLNGK